MKKLLAIILLLSLPLSAQEEKGKFFKSIYEDLFKYSTVYIAGDIKNAMLERTTLNSEQAKAWGLIHEIKSELFEIGSEVIPIQYQHNKAQ